MSTSVKHIHSGMRGVPTVNGVVGSGVIPVLDTFFITGWGLTTALSVTVASGIATASLTPGETFDRDSVVLVAGATPAELNGESRVLTSSNTAITWATTAADGVATGTITIKYAPQTGWSKVYAGTNKAVYRSNHVQSAGHYLRVDDTGTTTARIRGYESMSDVDTGVGPFPTDAQMSGGGYWWKSINANATAVKWRMFADERFLIVAIAAGYSTQATYLGAPPRGFGDPIALAPAGDAWCTLLSFVGSSSNSAAYASFVSQLSSGTQGQTVCPRAVSGLGGAVQMNNKSFTATVNLSSGSDGALGTLPSEVDGQIKTARTFSSEAATNKPPRAIVPGVHYIPQTGSVGVLADGDTLAGSGDLAGRKLLVVGDQNASGFGGAPAGFYLVDITGPWR